MEDMKEMFRDVLQQIMESELDEALGYEKSKRTSNDEEIQVSGGETNHIHDEYY